MENIEEILGIKTYPMNWPIGCGKEFKGVFDRNTRKVLAFSSDGRANGVKKVNETEAELGDAALDELLTPLPAPAAGGRDRAAGRRCRGI